MCDLIFSTTFASNISHWTLGYNSRALVFPWC